MNQSPTPKEAKPKSAAEFPLWLVTSLALGFVSAISLVYYFFTQRSKKASPQPLAAEPAPTGLEIIRKQQAPAAETPVETSEERTLPELNWEKVKPFLIPLLALVIAYTAQGIFDTISGNGWLRNIEWLIFLPEGTRLWLGSGLYVVSTVLWALIALPWRVIRPAISQPSTSHPTAAPKRLIPVLRFYLLLISGGTYFVSILSFLVNDETAFVRVLWVVGLVAFIIAQILAGGDGHPEAEESPKFAWWNWVVLALILGAAFWLRFYKLTTIPDDFHGDLASYGFIARDYLSGVQQTIFDDSAFSGTPFMDFLTTYFSMAVFGNNHFGLSMTAVINGMFSLLAVYLLIWRLFDSHRLAVLTTALVTINVAHIHFSRIVILMNPWPFGYFALFFLMDGLKARRPASFGLAGVFLGFALQSYFPGRVLVFIIGIFLLYAFFFRRNWITQNKRGLALMCVGALLAMGPSLAYHIVNLDSFVSRAREVFLFSPGVMDHLLYKYNTDSKLVVLLTQIKLTALMFNQSGDSGTHVGFPHPMFNSLISPLILLGFGLALRRWKDAGLFLILIWLGLISVLGSVLTIDAPPWNHLAGIIPAAALLIAVVLDQIFELAKKTLGARAGIPMTVLTTVFLVAVGYISWNQYYLAVRDNAPTQVRIGRYINSLPLDVTVCGILEPPLAVRETAFLAWPHKLVDIAPDAPDSELDKCTGSSIVWVLSPDNVGRLDAIRARWTEGVVETYVFPNSGYTFTFYLINVDSHPQSDIENLLPASPAASDIPSSNSKIPTWLFNSLVLGFILAVSLVYYFFVRRSRKEMVPLQPLETAKPVPTGLEIIKEKPVFVAEKIAPEPVAVVPLETSEDWTLPELNWEKVKPFLFPLLALMVAYVAQGVFDLISGNGWLRSVEWLASLSVDSRLWLGSGLYVVSAAFWALAALPLRTPLSAVRRGVSAHHMSAPRFYLLLVSGGAYLVSMLSFQINGETAFIRMLWGVGVVSFILAQFAQVDPHPEAEESPKFNWRNWLVLGLILAVGFWLRYYRLAVLPDDFHGDMASYGLVARDYLQGVEKNFFGYGYYAIPSMGFLPSALTMAVFGNNIFGLQMCAVLGGVFTLLAVYLLTWRLFDNHRLAALAAALTAINIPHIHFSRISAYMDPWPFGFFALFLLVDGLRARRFSSFGLAGILLGFSLQMYFSGRALIFVIALFLIYAFFFHRSWITQNKGGFFAMAAGVLLAIGPALISYLTDGYDYMLRSQQVFLFTDGVQAHLKYKYNTDSSLVVLWEQVKNSLLMFHYNGDSSTQFGFPHPLFDSLVSPLLMLGLGAALRRWKDAGMAFALVVLSVMVVLGGILTIDAPFWPRLVGVIPAAAMLIALPLEQLLNASARILGSRRSALGVALIVIFLASAGYLNWKQYYDFAKDTGSPSTYTGRYISRLPLDVTACGIVDPPLAVRETAFLAWPHKLVDIAPDAPDSELDKCTGSSIVWAISPQYIGRLDAIRERWPNGIVDERYQSGRDYTLTFYLVGVTPPAVEVEESTGISTTIFKVLGILAGFAISAILVWLVFRDLILSNLRSRRTGMVVESVPVSVKPQKPSSSLESAFDIFTRWYEEVASFDVSTITPKLAISILLPFLAIGLAYLAQTIIDQEVGAGLHLKIEALRLDTEGQRQLVASIIFFIAALLWTFVTAAGGRETSGAQTWQSVIPFQPVMGSIIQAVGLLVALSAIFLYALMDETALVRWLWLAGLALFLLSLLVKQPSKQAVLREESYPFRWWHAVTLLSLLALAFFLREYRLYDIPLDLSTDMASVGINARDYLLGVETRIFGTGWYYYPRLVFLPYTASMWLMGNNLYGMNFGTVILGTLNVLGVYLFIWRLFDRHRLAFLTAVLVTLNPAHIELSRIPSYVDPWTFGFLALFFFVDGLKGRRWSSLGLAGFLTGFTIASYPSGRAIIPILAVGLAAAWLFNRKWVTDNYLGFVWMFLGGLVSLGPNLVYFISDWNVYMQRSREVLITNPGVIDHLKFTYEVDSTWLILWEQVKRSVLQFNYYIDRSAQFSYPHPMFNSLISPLLFLGAGMSLYRWKKPAFLLSFSSFAMILTLGSILTNDAPTWVRLAGLIPFAALLIALVLDELASLLERLSLKPVLPLLLAGIALYLAQVGAADWNAYLSFVGDYNITRPEVQVGRYLDPLPDDITACGITGEYHIDQEEILFFGWPRQIIVVPEDREVLTPDLCPQERVVWILEPKYEDRLPQIQALSPGGIVEQHYTENGWHVFTSYLVP